MADQIYGFYKPYRNYLRNCPLLPSMEVVSAYLRNIQFKKPLPPEIELSPYFRPNAHWTEKFVPPWELAQLVEDLIRNAPREGKYDFRRWKDFAGAVNRLKNFEDDTSGFLVSENNVLMEVQRLAHRQFPWQGNVNNRTILRYFRIFSEDGLSSIFERQIGVTPEDYFRAAITLIAQSMNSFRMSDPPYEELPGISKVAYEKVRNQCSMEMGELRKKIEAEVNVDETIGYGFTPLAAFPLIRLVRDDAETVLCPVSMYLFNRVTSGTYYEILGAQGFGQAFGMSFQKYIGDLSNETSKAFGGSFRILPEQAYNVGK